MMDRTSTTSGGANVVGSSGDRLRRVMSSSSLTGNRVRNHAGEDLGKLTDIMLDVPSGRVAYAVLSFGGFLGLGDKLFAVPWGRRTLDETNKEFLLDVDREFLERTPGFDKDNWPDMSDPAWSSQLHQHYNVRPYWESDVDYPPLRNPLRKERAAKMAGKKR